MCARLAIVMLVAALVGSGSIVSASSECDQRLFVIVTYPDGDYDFGDAVNITVNVFRDGCAFDPDRELLIIGSNFHEVKLTRAGTGDFWGLAMIGRNDGSRGYIRLQGSAWDESSAFGEQCDCFTTIDLASESPLSARVRLTDPADISPAPGDAVEFGFDLTFLGAPVEPSGDSLRTYLRGPDGTEANVSVASVQKGRYEGSCVVPSDLHIGGMYELVVEAEYVEYTRTYKGGGSTPVIIEFLTTWARYSNITGSTADVEVHVTDVDGAPVEGALMALNFTFTNDSGATRAYSRVARTGADGMTRVELDYTNIIDSTFYVLLSGTVTSWGTVQYFDSWVKLREPRPLMYDSTKSLEVDLLTQEPLPVGTCVTLEHVARQGYTPMAGKTIAYYVCDEHQVYAAGCATTDGSGRFSFSINTTPTLPGDAPFHYLLTYYQHDFGDQWIGTAVRAVQVGMGDYKGYFSKHLDPKAQLAVTPFKEGGAVDVTLRWEGAAGGPGEVPEVLWGIGSSTDCMSWQQAEWDPWCFGYFIGSVRTVPCTWSDGAYHARFLRPSCLPTDVPIFVFGSVETADGVIHGALVEGLLPTPNAAPLIVVGDHPVKVGAGGALRLSGSATDDASVVRVEACLDGGGWVALDGTGQWTHDVPTKGMSRGNHTVQLRAFDGTRYSSIANATFTVTKPGDGSGIPAPGAGAAVMAFALAVWAARSRGRGAAWPPGGPGPTGGPRQKD